MCKESRQGWEPSDSTLTLHTRWGWRILTLEKKCQKNHLGYRLQNPPVIHLYSRVLLTIGIYGTGCLLGRCDRKFSVWGATNAVIRTLLVLAQC